MVSQKEEPHVLLVEDDRAVIKILSLSLRSCGFAVTSVETGGEALDHIKEGGFVAVVLDLGLPDGLGGAVLKHLQAGVRDSPSLGVISALTRTGGQRWRYSQAILPKPFNPIELADMLSKLIDRRTVPTKRIYPRDLFQVALLLSPLFACSLGRTVISPEVST
jgi:DNA-binding response OmpR family regulator